MGKSTGPCTPRGKARSSRNAAKHWIESRKILPEEQQDAAILRNGFTEDFNPQSLIERELIDDLTLNRLIRRRIDIAFTREFSKASIKKTARLQEDSERSAIQYWLRLAAHDAGMIWAHPGQSERVRPNLCIVALEALKRQISDRGPQREDLETLRRIFGKQPTEHAALAVRLLIRVLANPSVKDTTDEKEVKEFILEALKVEIENQKNWNRLAKDTYAAEFLPDLQEPPRPELETLLRYRAANTRELKDLLESLDRIRRLLQSAS
jgi:hypothetical protein